ncbi:MAG TPA: helix-turn-helix domain-containing protein [Kofleriaceae bacterium]|nr:helix-turn-helix domain-containing protein [Kofleriaceae bacterium]
MPAEIVILALDGVSDSGLAVTRDVLRAASTLAAQAGKPAPFRVTLASPRGGTVRTASGLPVAGTRALARVVGTARGVVRAGGGVAGPVVLVPGIWTERPDQLDGLLARTDVALAARLLARAHERGAIVGAACSATFLLASAGLLDARRATTTWWLAPEMRRRFPEIELVEHEALVVDERVITAGAVLAVTDLALHVVARFAGPVAARQTARVLLLDRHPSQAPYMALRFVTTDDAIVRRAESWARAHLADGFDIATLARRAGASPRTLARRLDAALGLSPIAFVQRLRLETAAQLLETSRLSMAEISARVGYEDADTLARLLKRDTGLSARELRRRAVQS